MKLFENSKFKIKNFHKERGGFVLLYTMLVASLVLLFALGITNTAYKESILSSSARDAGFSFFSADSGIECALYADRLGGGSTSCFGSLVNFSAGLPVDLVIDGRCAKIQIEKDIPSPGSTRITSRGYNVDCNNINSPRSVERAIRVTY